MEEQRIKSMLREPDLEFRDAPPSKELSVDEDNKLALIDEANRMAVIHKKNPDNMTIEDMDIGLRRMSNLFQNPIAEPERVAIRNKAVRTTPVEKNDSVGDEFKKSMLREGVTNVGKKLREKKAEGSLVGGQKELDKNNDGDITGEDFKMLREGKQDGGLLVDDREKYVLGGILAKLVSKSFAKRNPDAVLKLRGIDDKFGITDDITELKKLSPEDAKKALNYFKAEKLDMKQGFKEQGRLDPSDANYYGEAERKRIFSEIDKDFEKQFEVLNSIIKREAKQEGGMLMDDQMADMMQTEETPDMENQMSNMMSPVAETAEEELQEQQAIEESQAPDEMMEDNYIDFLIDEALDENEEEMLMQELEANPQLSMLFDKVMEVAMEFSGSGPVEGPGSEVSDSIPARLSDGEFVFTAKAVDVIGADNLMSMMKQAEAQAEERQPAQEGGLMEEENVMPVEQQPVQQNIRVTKETVGPQAGMQEEEDLVGDELKKSMLSTRPYVRS